MSLGSGMARNLFSQSRSVCDVAEVKPKSVSSSGLAAESGSRAIRQIRAVKRTRRIVNSYKRERKLYMSRTCSRQWQTDSPQIYADKRGSNLKGRFVLKLRVCSRCHTLE